MAVTFLATKPSAADADIRALEQSLGVPLPNQYRAHLLAHNGGHPNPDLIIYRDRQGRSHGSDIAWFFNVGPYEYENLLWYRDTYRDRIPPATLPIGRSSGGSLFLLQLPGPGPQPVYFWDSNREPDDGEPVTAENVYWLATDFHAFLAAIAAP
jgi:hypothetical protein